MFAVMGCVALVAGALFLLNCIKDRRFRSDGLGA